MYETILNLIESVLAEDDPIAKDKILELDDLNRLQFTSISFIRLIVELEEEFSIEFDDDVLGIGVFNSVEDLCKYIENKTQYK